MKNSTPTELRKKSERGHNLFYIFSSFYVLLDRISFCTSPPQDWLQWGKKIWGEKKKVKITTFTIKFFHFTMLDPFCAGEQILALSLMGHFCGLFVDLLLSKDQAWIVSRWLPPLPEQCWIFLLLQAAGGKAHVKSSAVASSSRQAKFLRRQGPFKRATASYLLQSLLAFSLAHRKYLEASTILTPSSAATGCCNLWTFLDENQTQALSPSKSRSQSPWYFSRSPLP